MMYTKSCHIGHIPPETFKIIVRFLCAFHFTIGSSQFLWLSFRKYTFICMIQPLRHVMQKGILCYINKWSLLQHNVKLRLRYCVNIGDDADVCCICIWTSNIHITFLRNIIMLCGGQGYSVMCTNFQYITQILRLSCIIKLCIDDAHKEILARVLYLIKYKCRRMFVYSIFRWSGQRRS